MQNGERFGKSGPGNRRICHGRSNEIPGKKRRDRVPRALHRVGERSFGLDAPAGDRRTILGGLALRRHWVAAARHGALALSIEPGSYRAGGKRQRHQCQQIQNQDQSEAATNHNEAILARLMPDRQIAINQGNMRDARNDWLRSLGYLTHPGVIPEASNNPLLLLSSIIGEILKGFCSHSCR